MSDKLAWAAAAVLLASIAVRPGAALAEPLAMSSDAANAVHAFAAATQQLDKARAAMAALEAGEKPQGGPRDWAGVVGGYEAAAEGIRKSGGPLLPDASAFGVPSDHLRSCGTRAAALAKVDKQLKAVHGLSQQVAEARALLRNRLEAAHQADETRRYLVKAAAKLGGSRGLAEAFTWSWQDFDVAAARSIAVYANELRRQQERVDRASTELRVRAAALSGQLDTFAGAKDCLLAGRWTGSRSQGGAVAGLSLQLVASGTSLAGSANLDGKAVAVRSVSVSGSSVSLTFAEGKGTMKGTVSPDGRSYHGSFSSMDGPGSFSLLKQ